MTTDPLPSAPVPTKYDTTTARAIRGLEARTRAKWEADGWEFVSQQQGALSTELTFRRPKAAVPWKLLAVIGGVLVVIGIIIGVNVALSSGSGDVKPEAIDTQTETSAPTTEPVAEPESTTEPTPPPKAEVLTAANNSDLAALLAGPQDGPSVANFAAQYAGQVIEFNGAIAAMNPHDGYTTRYDILISVGDYSETQSFGGPSFQFRDVNITNDLNLIGTVPDSIGVGSNLRVSARVGAYESNTTLFLLKPVVTQVR